MKSMNCLDIFCIIRELQGIKDSKVEKLYQPKKSELLIELHSRISGKGYLRIMSGTAIFMTKSKKEYTNFPPHFCMFLRKHLRGAIVKELKQRKEDRIVEITFQTKEDIKRLIIELFGTGNIILCDNDYRIIALEQVQVFKDRKLLVHQTYQSPESDVSITNINSLTFKRKILSSGRDDAVKALASLGLGGKYSEEICARAGIPKNKLLKDLDKDEYDKLYTEFESLVRQLKYKDYESEIIFENDTPEDYTPVPFKIYEKAQKKKTDSFNDALDEVYTSKIIKEVIEQKQETIEKEAQRLRLVKEKQEETIKQYGATAEKKRLTGEQVIQKIDTIEQIRSAINYAKDKGDSWTEIENKLQKDKENGIEAALLVKSINPIGKTFMLDTEPEIEIKLYETTGKQVSELYEKAKKLENKVETALQYIEKTQSQIANTENTEIELTRKDAPQQVEAEEKKIWYEKFKYFYTSQNKLVVCGKDATSNEILIKKYMEEKDTVFHADIAGSPFGIIKGGSSDETELKETATFVGSHSRAWREGFTTTDIFWVTPSQISKEGGLQRGSFMVYGRRNYFYGVPLEIAIGIENGKIISGPENAVKQKISNYVIISPGQITQHDFTKTVKSALNYEGNADDFIQHLPSGNSSIKRVETKTIPHEKAEAKPLSPWGFPVKEPKKLETESKEDESPEPEVIRYGEVEEEQKEDKKEDDDFFFNGYDELVF